MAKIDGVALDKRNLEEGRGEIREGKEGGGEGVVPMSGIRVSLLWMGNLLLYPLFSFSFHALTSCDSPFLSRFRLFIFSSFESKIHLSLILFSLCVKRED